MVDIDIFGDALNIIIVAASFILLVLRRDQDHMNINLENQRKNFTQRERRLENMLYGAKMLEGICAAGLSEAVNKAEDYSSFNKHHIFFMSRVLVFIIIFALANHAVVIFRSLIPPKFLDAYLLGLTGPTFMTVALLILTATTLAALLFIVQLNRHHSMVLESNYKKIEVLFDIAEKAAKRQALKHYAWKDRVSLLPPD